MPFTAYIVDCVRTPGGKKNGSLREWHPADLGAVVIDALLDRTGIDGAAVDDVIFGCVSQVGSQSSNVARNVVLSSRLPESVPATTVDRQCGSSQQALHFAAQAVMSGVQDVVIAGGVEVMSAVPIGANVADGFAQGHGLPWSSQGIRASYGKVMFSQFEGAELVAQKCGLTRQELDEFGAESHRRAVAAIKAGHFANELIPCAGKSKTGEAVTLSADEGVRPGTTAAKLGKLRTLRKGEGGVITAGTASQITDGASAVLICNEAGLRRLGLVPRAKIVCQTVVGSDPVLMLYGPIPATRMLLEKTGLSIDDIDVYEVNEAFASVPVAWAKELGADHAKLNVNGGAIALGHPLGATGTKLMTTLVNELERRGGRFALQAICEGGGTANATLIERIAPGTYKPAAAVAPAARL